MHFRINRSFILFSLVGAMTVGLLSAAGMALKLAVRQSSYFDEKVIVYVAVVGAFSGLLTSIVAYGVLHLLRKSSKFVFYPSVLGFCLGFLSLIWLAQGRVTAFGNDLPGLLFFPIVPWIFTTVTMHYMAMKHIRRKFFSEGDLK